MSGTRSSKKSQRAHLEYLIYRSEHAEMQALRATDPAEKSIYYRRAAQFEEDVLNKTRWENVIQRGISCVRAVDLYLKGGLKEQACHLAANLLLDHRMPILYKRQIRALTKPYA